MKPSADTHTPEIRQNWSLMIGLAIILLIMVVMVINLSVYSMRLADSTTPHPLWLQLLRFCGIVGSVAIGGWLLWQLIRQTPQGSSSSLNHYHQEARRYTQQIEQLLSQHHNGQQLVSQVQQWRQTIEAITQTLDELAENDPLIQADLRQLPTQISQLEQQLSHETNPLLRGDLEQMLQQRQQQRLALEQLATSRRWAEIQIERAIAVLGTVYSQLLTYRSTFHGIDYQHLADNVAEEVNRLQDYLEALHEVKQR